MGTLDPGWRNSVSSFVAKNWIHISSSYQQHLCLQATAGLRSKVQIPLPGAYLLTANVSPLT
eukprot:5825677-Lingulodinium_polyedra.AAC.1